MALADPPIVRFAYRTVFLLGATLVAVSVLAGTASVLISEHRLPGLRQDPLAGAQSAMARHDLSRAASEYRGAAAIDRSHEFQLTVSEGLANARDFRGAGEVLARAWERSPDDPRVLTSLGWILFLQRRIDEASLQFERAIQASPADAHAHAGLGEVRLEQDRYPEAIALFSRSLEIEPATAAVRNSLGVALALSGQPAAAVAQFNIANRLSPSADVLANLQRAQSTLKNEGQRREH